MWHVDPGPSPCDSLIAEAVAMLRAVCADFQALADVEVVALRDSRLERFELAAEQWIDVRSAEDESSRFAELASDADWTLLIAPEFDGLLLSRARQVEQLGGRLLSPGSEFIELTADKHLLNEHLNKHHVRVPSGVALTSLSMASEFSYPAVLKPRFGAGSVGVRRIGDFDQLAKVDLTEHDFCLQSYRAGLAASVAVLCGPGGPAALPACRQHLTDDGHFQYLGGSLPLEAGLARRAESIGLAALRCLPRASGYVGIDLMLGTNPNGEDDYVIEVNPRLTTSYVGLRQLSKHNLVAAMLDVVDGRACELSYSSQRVEFTSDGKILKHQPLPSVDLIE